MKHVRSCYLAWYLLGLMMAFLPACASSTKLTDHAFSFDTLTDSPDAEVLDYQYSKDKPEPWQYRDGHIGQRRNINGPFPRGDSLYVKWRIKSTGDVYEDTVNLRGRLPADITRHRIHFVIKGPQLYVYLVTPQKRPAGSPKSPLRMYSDLEVVTIYPDQSEKNYSK